MSSRLPLDLASLRAAVRRGESFSFRPFWGHLARKDGELSDACFSQWWPARFTLDGVSYSSAEQYMMAEKTRRFEDREALEQILLASDPGEIKQLGRRVSQFDEAMWALVRFDVVIAGSIGKFGQDPRLGAYLVATGDAVLVEASPVDTVWGIGLAASDPRVLEPEAWNGENPLGFALMHARARISARL